MGKKTRADSRSLSGKVVDPSRLASFWIPQKLVNSFGGWVQDFSATPGMLFPVLKRMELPYQTSAGEEKQLRLT